MELCPTPGVAIDLGCGSGAETVALIEKGWRVLAIDAETSSLEAIRSLMPAGSDRLTLRKSRFEDLTELPDADFVYSFHSLPFCERASFDRVLALVRSGVVPGGVLAVSLFGPNDAWVKGGKVSGISKDAWLNSLIEFEMLHFHEVDDVGPTALEGPKHWHTFETIARKK